ncbi:hypothetical protein [Desulfonatronum thioautotrophicum]|uniref:hypothetical protein n=1 Tax=Desulfonatronum thioautotrophicum TaxID=617001 RepID=UPI0005EB5087|nr:hypothetical protein [Desulfonatronum thioautotrophicum]
MNELNNIREAFKIIHGRELKDTEIQRLITIANIFGFKTNDPMFPIFAGLDIYYGAFSKFPKKISESVQTSASDATYYAAIKAEAQINMAVAQLVPSVEKAVEKAAEKTIDRVKIMESSVFMLTIIFIISVMTILGIISGSRILDSLKNGYISWFEFWEYIKWGIALGISGPIFMFLAVAEWLNFNNYEGKSWWRWLAGFISLTTVCIIMYKVFTL